jgi:hypothetical protein
MSQTLVVTAQAKPGGARTLVDGTIKAEFYISKELPASEMTTLFQLMKQGEGWLLFSPNPIEEASIPREKAESGFDGKSPSTRLYNILFVRWKELTSQSVPFDQYYREQMDKIIGLLKRDLPTRP